MAAAGASADRGRRTRRAHGGYAAGPAEMRCCSSTGADERAVPSRAPAQRPDDGDLPRDRRRGRHLRAGPRRRPVAQGGLVHLGRGPEPAARPQARRSPGLGRRARRGAIRPGQPAMLTRICRRRSGSTGCCGTMPSPAVRAVWGPPARCPPAARQRRDRDHHRPRHRNRTRGHRPLPDRGRRRPDQLRAARSAARRTAGDQ